MIRVEKADAQEQGRWSESAIYFLPFVTAGRGKNQKHAVLRRGTWICSYAMQ